MLCPENFRGRKRSNRVVFVHTHRKCTVPKSASGDRQSKVKLCADFGVVNQAYRVLLVPSQLYTDIPRGTDVNRPRTSDLPK